MMCYIAGEHIVGFLQTSLTADEAYVLGCSGAGIQVAELLDCAPGSQITPYLMPTPILPTLFHRIFIKKTLIKKSLLFR